MRSLEPYLYKKVVVLKQDASAVDAARAMRDHDIGCIVVSNTDGKVVGMVTDRDYACRLAAEYPGMPAQDIPLSHIMTLNPVVASESAGVGQIVDLMESYGVRRIPIVTEDGQGGQKCVGIVSFDDLILSGVADRAALRRIVCRQIGRRRESAISRSPRSETRARQALSRFYHHVAARTGVAHGQVPDVSLYLLSALCRRATFSAAANLIARLPSALQDSLLRLPPGPDRGIDSKSMAAGLVRNFSFPEDFARHVLGMFFGALEECLDPGGLRSIQAQLPEEMRWMFDSGQPILESESTLETTRMNLTCPSFKSGAEIPRRHSQEGENLNPSLEWSHVPAETQEFALICEDPDAPTERAWVHWVLYGISPKVTHIPEGMPGVGKIDLPVAALQGENTSGRLGYSGPMPPEGHGRHRYFFRLFALNRKVFLGPGATRDQLLNEIRGHVIAEAVLMGTYERKLARRAA